MYWQESPRCMKLRESGPPPWGSWWWAEVERIQVNPGY